ncbi:MAG: exodeoxyribonuclease VII large subunit [Bacteroidota bacterium]
MARTYSLFDAPPPPSAAPPETVSVGALTAQIKDVIEARFGHVRVEGEIANWKAHGSGHCYFSLRDADQADAQVRAVLWRTSARGLAFRPSDGMRVRAVGRIAVYEPRGQYQLIVETMQPAGAGAWRQAFDALKAELADEGLLDAARKQPLPRLPERIGLVTSGSSAALQDMLMVLGTRFPSVEVLLCPVKVQGDGAANEIAEAIDAFNLAADDRATPAELRADVLIVGRGGGSVEDLWAFNEEAVARAIARSSIPVISAVGHETDVSIADLVADVRAATPTHAAELAVPDRRDVAGLVYGFHEALRLHTGRVLAEHRHRVQSLVRSRGFNRPLDRLDATRQRTDDLAERLRLAGERLTRTPRLHLDALAARLRALDPEAPLRRGYALVGRGSTAVRSAALLDAGDTVTLRFLDGERTAEVKAAP